MKVILASTSPRRKELLAKVVSIYDIIPANCDESSTATEGIDYALEVACAKAVNVAHRTEGDRVVIGCDTVVEINGKILGKPHSVMEAVEMLNMLSGETHCVHTGVCLIAPLHVRTFTVTSRVKFKPLTAKQIEDYIATGSPFDKAGAYGVQDSGFVESIDGSYDNVMGLPTEKLAEELEIIFKG